MKQILLAALGVFIATLLASCEKDREINAPAHPQMTYTDLSSRVVNITTPAGIDISGDGTSDVWLEIFYTRDQATNTDYHQFMVSSGETSRLMIQDAANAPVLAAGAAIGTQLTNGYEWRSPAQAGLAKRTLVQGTGAITWEGAWKNAQRRFLAVQVSGNGLVYNGWIELSFDTAAEKVILHRAAISREPAKDIEAGK